jgi:hypothetical protein
MMHEELHQETVSMYVQLTPVERAVAKEMIADAAFHDLTEKEFEEWKLVFRKIRHEQ